MKRASGIIEQVFGNFDETSIEKLSVEDVAKLGEFFRLFMDVMGRIATLKSAGVLDHISLNDLDRAKKVAAELWNVEVTREQALKITGKSDSAFNSKICRSGIKHRKEPMYKYKDMIDILEKRK